MIQSLLDEVRHQHGITLRPDDPVITTVLLSEAFWNRQQQNNESHFTEQLTRIEMMAAALDDKNQKIAERTLSAHTNALIQEINRAFQVQRDQAVDAIERRIALSLSNHTHVKSTFSLLTIGLITGLIGFLIGYFATQ